MLIAFSIVIATLSLEGWIFYVYNLKGAMDMSGAIQIALGVIMIILINAIAFYLPMSGKETTGTYRDYLSFSNSLLKCSIVLSS